MPSKILLYDRYEVTDQPKQIPLVNPTFNDGSAGWTYTGAWTFGSDYAYTNGYGYLKQVFPQPIDPTLNYRVNFTVTDRVAGGLTVRLTNDQIATVTANGDYSIPYKVSGGTTPTDISFRSTLDTFDGRVKKISIVQDTELSPLSTSVEWTEKSYLEMKGGESVELTYQISDATDLGKRFGAYSKGFTLPGTPLNKISLAHLHTNEWTPTVFDPRNKSKAVLFVDDQVAFEGFLSLKSVVRHLPDTDFEVELYEGTVDLLDAVKGKYITDLDLGALSHTLNLENVLASWSTGRTWTDGYVYPLYLILEESERSIAKDFAPAYYNRYLLDKIITDAGFSYEISPLAESKINAMLTAPVGRHPNATTQDIQAATSVAHSEANTTVQFLGRSGPPFYGSAQGYWNLDEVDQDENGNFSNSVFTAPYTGAYDLNLDYDAAVTMTGDYFGANTLNSQFFDNNFVAIELVDVVSGAVILGIDRWSYPPSYDGWSVTDDLSFSGSIQTNLTAGQRVAIRIRVIANLLYTHDAGSTLFPFPVDTVVTIGGSFSIGPSGTGWLVSEGMRVDAASWLPQITQEQFLNDHIKALNLYLFPVADNPKAVKITSYDELYDDQHQIDRSGRVDMGGEITTEWLTEISASLLRMGHKKPDDKDEWNNAYTSQNRGAIYGDIEVSLSNDLFNDVSETRLQTWTPCPITRDNAQRLVPAVQSRTDVKDVKLLVRSTVNVTTDIPIKYFNDSTRQVETWTASEYTPTVHIDHPTSSTWTATFGDVAGVMSNQTVPISTNSFFDDHYREQVEQLKEGRLFTVNMRLSAADVDEHLAHLGARIWIDELNNWFTLYSFSYDPTTAERGLSKVKLLESGPPQFKSRSLPHVNPWPHTLTPIGVDNPSDPIRWINASGGGHVLGPSGGIAIGPANTDNNKNLIIGSGNTIYGNGNIITGNNNYVDNGVTGTTIFGGQGITATTSNTTYFDGFGVLSPTGATFYSGITITYSGITVGGVTITTSGITFPNGVVFSGGGASTPTLITPGTNIVTGGTDVNPVISTVTSPVFTNINLSGDSSMLLGGNLIGGFNPVYPPLDDYSTILAVLLAGDGNTLAGSNYASGIYGGVGNTLTDTSYAAILASSFSDINGFYNSAVIAGNGIIADKSNTLFTSRIDAGEIWSAGSPLNLTALTLPTGTDGDYLYYSASTGWIPKNLPIVSTVGGPFHRGYAALNSLASTDFNGSTGSIGSAMIGGFANLVYSSDWSNTVFVGGSNAVSGSTSSSVFNGGYLNWMIDETASVINGGNQNTLKGGANNLIAANNQSSILNCQNNALVAGEFNVISGATTRYTAIIAARGNAINSGVRYSAIVGATGLTASQDETLYCKHLNVAGTITGWAFSGGGGTPTYVQPGTNIQTGGTDSAPIVSVVASPSFTTVSATTFVSGGTNVYSLFEPVMQRSVMTSDVLKHATPTAVSGLSWTAQPNSIYQVTYQGAWYANSATGGLIISMNVPSGASGSCITTFGAAGLSAAYTVRAFTTYSTATTSNQQTYSAGVNTQDWPWKVEANVITTISGGTVNLLMGGTNNNDNTIRSGSSVLVTRIA